MKVLISQAGEMPRLISDTFAELPTLPTPGPSAYLTTQDNPGAVAVGTVAWVKEFAMEFIFNGVSWSPYIDEIIGGDASTKPLSPPDGAKFRNVQSGELFIAFGGTWSSSRKASASYGVTVRAPIS